MAGTTRVVWREWYNEAAIKSLTAMGTLPRNEIELDLRWMDGNDIAASIAEDANKHDSESFREGGEVVIIEPEEFAGTYKVDVDYVPTFTAYKSEDF